MKGLDVAKYIIDKCYRMGKPITNLHLQGVLYFLQGEYYRRTKKFLIEDDFIAWRYGPMLPEVYDTYSWYYSSRIYESYSIKIPEDIRNIIDPIIEEKRNKPAGALINEAQEPGSAWSKCYKSDTDKTVIPKDLIKADFG